MSKFTRFGSQKIQYVLILLKNSVGVLKCVSLIIDQPFQFNLSDMNYFHQHIIEVHLRKPLRIISIVCWQIPTILIVTYNCSYRKVTMVGSIVHWLSLIQRKFIHLRVFGALGNWWGPVAQGPKTVKCLKKYLLKKYNLNLNIIK